MARLFKTTKELIEKEQAKKQLNHEYYLKHRKKLLRRQHDKHLEKKNSSIKKDLVPKFPSAQELKIQQRIETFQRTIREIDEQEARENSKVAKKEIQEFEPWYPKKRSETQSQSEDEKRERKRQLNHDYYLRNKERLDQKNCKWRKEHPEKVRESGRKWSREHPEFYRARYQKNLEVFRLRSLVGYHKHREQILEAKQLEKRLEKARREFPETIAKLTEFLVQETKNKK